MSGPCFGVGPYPDGGPEHPPEDQVIRLRRFQAAYPEVEIERPDYGRHQLWWHACVVGRRIASDLELSDLLDHLARLFPDADGDGT